mmetsp:Transcript_23913/g.75326  ORF Transcript_23913/g.75326 Transcript_23913/m.75326 type:complete len:294 (-) Transcript_23913:46-927(-)
MPSIFFTDAGAALGSNFHRESVRIAESLGTPPPTPAASVSAMRLNSLLPKPPCATASPSVPRLVTWWYRCRSGAHSASVTGARARERVIIQLQYLLFDDRARPQRQRQYIRGGRVPAARRWRCRLRRRGKCFKVRPLVELTVRNDVIAEPLEAHGVLHFRTRREAPQQLLLHQRRLLIQGPVGRIEAHYGALHGPAPEELLGEPDVRRAVARQVRRCLAHLAVRAPLLGPIGRERRHRPEEQRPRHNAARDGIATAKPPWRLEARGRAGAEAYEQPQQRLPHGCCRRRRRCCC